MKFARDWAILTIKGGVIVIFIAAMLISIRLAKQGNSMASLAAHTRETLFHTAKILSLAVDNETSRRGFILTGQDDFLPALERSKQDLLQEISQLKKLTADNRMLQRGIDSLLLYTNKMLGFSDNVVRMRKGNGLIAAAGMVAAGEGKEDMYLLRHILGHIENEQNRILQARKHIQAKETVLANLLLTGIGVLILGLVLVLFRKDQRDKIKRKKTEAQLKESEERYRLLVSGVKDYAIYLIDREGNIASWNEGARNIKKYEQEEIIGKHISIFYTKKDKEQQEPDHNLSMAKQHGNFENEGWRVRKDGSLFWAHVVFTALYDDTGNLKGYAKVTRDITERKNSEEKFKGLLESAPDPMIIMDEKGKIVLVNRRTKILFGYERNELTDQGIELLIPADFWTKYSAYERNYFAPSNPKAMSAILELFAERKDGTIFPVEISLYPLETEETTLISASIRDITARIKSAEEITYLARLMEDTSDAIYSIDASYLIKSWNKAAELLFGFSPEEVLGKVPTQILRVQIDEAGRDQIHKVLMEQGYWKGELTYLRKDGTPIITLISTTVTRNPKGLIDGFVSVCRDITVRKQAEEQLRKFNIELEKQVNEKTAEIKNVFERVTDAFVALDNQLNFTYANGKAEQTFDFPAGYFTGKNLKDLFPRSLKDEFYLAAVDCQQIQQYAFLEYYGPSYKKWFEIHIYPSETGLSIYIKDINEKKKAEEALRLSEKKYKLLFEGNPMPMWMINLEKVQIIDVNESAIKHYGYSKEEFLALDVKKMRPPEDEGINYQEFSQHFPGINDRGIWRHKKKDNSLIYIEPSAYDFIYEGQQTRLILANDITEKLASEEKLQKSYQDIRQLASHLQNIREEERAEMAREIHDELGQQITGLKMDVSWLSKKLSTEDKAVKQKITEVMDLLDETVKTVRKIATDLRPSILDDLGIVEAMEWQSREFEKRTGIRVTFQSNNTSQTIAGNIVTGLFRIYQESLTNVARHAEGATLVTTILEQKGASMELTITDNGEGFDLTKTTDKKTLGLLGMKERTLMMGGEYHIISHPGKGTKVKVSVPLPAA